MEEGLGFSASIPNVKQIGKGLKNTEKRKRWRTKVIYKNIKDQLGEKWLNNQFNSIEYEDSKNKGLESIFKGFFAEIDTLIGKHVNVEGFKKWVKESKSSKNFEDCLFELICIDELVKINKVIIKAKNGDKIPDAFLEDKNIYVEMTNLKDVPSFSSIELKVNDLCEKSQERFKDSLGIHFLGINGFFEYSEKDDRLVPKKELSILIKDLQKKLQKLEKNILYFVCFHNWIGIHPNIGKSIWHREKPYVIFNGNLKPELIKNVLGDFDISGPEDSSNLFIY